MPGRGGGGQRENDRWGREERDVHRDESENSQEKDLEDMTVVKDAL